MSLILKNKQVYDFYQTHPNFDFEKMNILLLDLLNGFSESVYPSLNQTVASKLLDQMTALQGQLLKQQQDFLQWQHEQEVWKLEFQKDIQKWSEKTLEKVAKTADKESLVEFFEKINDKLSHPPKPPKPH
jgi:hypothetical protein